MSTPTPAGPRPGRRQTIVHALAVLVGVVGGFALGYGIVVTARVGGGGTALALMTTVEGGLFAFLGFPYLRRAWGWLDTTLKTTPLPDLLTALVGMIVGLVVAVLVGDFVRTFPYGVPLSAVLAALLAFFGASLGLTRRGELLALAGRSPGGEGPRRLKKVLLDTSVVIDGRVLDVAATGFLDYPLVLTRGVLRELQQVADSGDAVKRNRGRRGLDVLGQLQQVPGLQLEFTDDAPPAEGEIDHFLIELARRQGWAVMTNDFNLNRVARLEGVEVLNLNELAGAMRPVAIPGEELTVTLTREGREAGQAVGYLDDGTMVVVENGRRLLNQTVATTVTSVLQTAAGRMIFAQLAEGVPGRRGRQAAR